MTTASSVDPSKLLAVVSEVAREARPHFDAYVSLDSSLERDLGLDSLARVEVVLRLEREFGASLPEQALASSETPRDLLRFLLAAAGAAPQAADRTVASLAQSEGVRPPEQARTLTEALEYHVERQPERLCVFLHEDQKDTPLSYRGLWQGSLAYAARLAAAGVAPGRPVAIMLPTSLEYLYCFYGTLLAGGIPVPLYPPARLATIEDHMTRHVGVLKSAEAAIMVTIPEAKPLAWLLRAQVESLRAVLVPEDFSAQGDSFTPVRASGGQIGFLQYTSGSTGQPKGVVLTHANLLANVRAMGKAARATSADVFVSWLPLYHDMGLIGGCFATMVLGFPVVLMSPLAFLSRPSQWLRAIHRHRGTISGGPNFAYELCMRRIPEHELEGLDLSSWRFAFNGAEPVSPDTLSAFEERFSKWNFRKNVISPVYGLAECSVGLAFTPPGEPWQVDLLDREIFSTSGEARPARPDDPAPLKIVGCGRVIPEHDMRVVDAAGLELPDRAEGHLQFKGPSATSGYYRNPEATRTLFDGEWLNTGDRAYLSEGMLYLTGREKDVIIRGGRNISPYELEEAVGDLPGIRRGCVAAFGSLDRASGTERVVVLAETRERDASIHDSLRRKINELALGLIGAPVDDIVLAPPHTVPKTSSGKIRRVAAREYYERGPSAVRTQAVWWQLARLALTSVAPQLRRGLRVARGIVYAGWAWLLFALLFLFILVVSAVSPGRAAWNFTGACARLFFRALAIPVAARGLENIPASGPFVIASNHTSYLDGALLLAALDWRDYAFVAKRELAANPLTRIFLKGIGAEFVERFDVAKSAEHADELVGAAKRGVSLIVFPEGTLSRQTGLMPFRTGAFQVAAQSGIPVVPAALRGVRSVLRDGRWYPRRAPVAVTFGAPVAPDGEDWAAAVRLRDRVRAEILRHCGEPDLGDGG
ncbi:MAG: acyl-phosphate glycerol 3-phosphate acyltransferase [Betaproteobacteria bacterium RIFCSPLOWO2_12_FULL_68_19]|nr:MAG: acyl-phosphate glycerol 3-phosphate acyltransferase [Betaproteobacteria bacterium RIFCSPLOWO2_12_FULL_68_19]